MKCSLRFIHTTYIWHMRQKCAVQKKENFLSLRQHNGLLHMHASNARRVNEPLTSDPIPVLGTKVTSGLHVFLKKIRNQMN